MHCLLTALGSYGDVFPAVAVGAAMQQRGHRVAVVANPHFADLVENAGLALEPIGTREDYERLTRTRGLWEPRRGLGVVIEEGALGLLEPLYELVTRVADPADTVIAAHGLDLASRVAAETTSVRVASLVYAPLALWSNESPPRMPIGVASPASPRWLHRLQFAAAERLVVPRVLRPLARFRESLELDPVSGSYADWYYRVAPPMALFPDWFVDPTEATPTDWPAGAVTTGFPFGDALVDGRLPSGLQAMLDAGDPPIVFTPGSAMRDGERFFRTAVAACERLGRRGVLLSKYADHLPSELPPSVVAPGFTPLAKLLPRCAAFVHHGGIGSSARALAAGVPQLIQPMGFDQFDNAWRLRRLGVAEELKPTRFTTDRVAASLDRLTRDAGVAAASRGWAERCDRGAALEAACRALEARFAQKPTQ